jgi:L-threonylcarbamoyladenylate synthase
VARELLESFPNPIAAPSANKSGELTLLRSTDVWESFQNFEDFNLLEGQTPHIGLESTILDLSEENPLILRSGFITSESIEEILGVPVKNHTPSHHQEIKAPGMMLRHYAPQKSLKMNSLPSSDVLYLGFGKQDGILNLSPSADLIEAAANLYIMIKDLDDLDSDIETIAVAPIPHEGIGIAINDRLKRACGFYDKR